MAFGGGQPARRAFGVVHGQSPWPAEAAPPLPDDDEHHRLVARRRSPARESGESLAERGDGGAVGGGNVPRDGPPGEAPWEAPPPPPVAPPPLPVGARGAELDRGRDCRSAAAGFRRRIPLMDAVLDDLQVARYGTALGGCAGAFLGSLPGGGRLDEVIDAEVAFARTIPSSPEGLAGVGDRRRVRIRRARARRAKCRGGGTRRRRRGGCWC